MAQTKTIQLLRSSSLYVPSEGKTALENAKAALTALTGRKDGEIVLARYQEASGPIKSVLGIYHDATGIAPAGWTFIQDITSSSAGLTQLQAVINKIEESVGLGNDGTKSDFSGAAVTDNVIGASDTLIAAIQKAANAIAGMDKAASAVDGQVVTTVSEVNGVVSESKANVKDLQLGGYSKDDNATGAIGSTDTVNTALSKLENKIAKNTVSSSDKTVTINTTGATTDLSVNIDGTTLVKNTTSGVISSDLKIRKEKNLIILSFII